MKYILVFLTLIWTLTKAEYYDEICNHPTKSLESLAQAKCGFEPVQKPPLPAHPPRPKSGHRSLNSKKPEVIHLVSLQRLFLNSSLLYSSCNPQIFHQKLHIYEDIIESTYFQTT